MSIPENLTPIKRCRHCQRLLPVTSFYKYKRSKDGLDKYCKECHDAMTNLKKQKPMSIKTTAKKKTSQDPAILYASIQHVSDEDIVKEIRRRGYTGSLEFSKTITI